MREIEVLVADLEGVFTAELLSVWTSPPVHPVNATIAAKTANHAPTSLRLRICIAHAERKAFMATPLTLFYFSRPILSPPHIILLGIRLPAVADSGIPGEAVCGEGAAEDFGGAEGLGLVMHFLRFRGVGNAVGGADDIEVMEMACAGAPLTKQIAVLLRLQGVSRLRRPATIGLN